MPTDPTALRKWLTDRIEDIESGGRAHPGASTSRTVPTGWADVDSTLPTGGLALGATHEWLGVDSGATGAGEAEWTPPLLALTHLARQAARVAEGAWVAWIGRRVWPYPHALEAVEGGASAGLLDRSLLIDPPDSATRLWAIDLALRCAGMVVVADGSRLTTAASRRLQLAASAGGTLGLLARPARDRPAISAAMTRWEIRHGPAAQQAESGRELWEVELVRCKGAQPDSHRARTWMVERESDGLLRVPAAVAHRPRPAAAAS